MFSRVAMNKKYIYISTPAILDCVGETIKKKILNNWVGGQI